MSRRKSAREGHARRPRVYLDTSVIGRLTESVSHRDPRIQQTHDWWQKELECHDPVISKVVVHECRAGSDRRQADARIAFLRAERLWLIRTTRVVYDLADSMVAAGVLPDDSLADAKHIAAAAVHGIEYLVSWDRRHIVNPARSMPPADGSKPDRRVSAPQSNTWRRCTMTTIPTEVFDAEVRVYRDAIAKRFGMPSATFESDMAEQDRLESEGWPFLPDPPQVRPIAEERGISP